MRCVAPILEHDATVGSYPLVKLICDVPENLAKAIVHTLIVCFLLLIESASVNDISIAHEHAITNCTLDELINAKKVQQNGEQCTAKPLIFHLKRQMFQRSLILGSSVQATISISSKVQTQPNITQSRTNTRSNPQTESSVPPGLFSLLPPP